MCLLFKRTWILGKTRVQINKLLIGKEIIMNTRDENLKKLEARIKVLENELYELKREVSIMREKTKEGDIDTEDFIYKIAIEDINLSNRSLACLKRGGINTIGDVLSRDLFKVRNLNLKTYNEVMSKVKELKSNPDAIKKKMAEARVYETKEETAKRIEFGIEISKKMIPSLEVYTKFRKLDKAKDIAFNHFSGNFTKFYRRFNKDPDGFLFDRYCNESVYSLWEECMNGKHPEMKKLLLAKECNIELIKAAVIEDICEVLESLNHNTKTYEYMKKFLEAIKEYKE